MQLEQSKPSFFKGISLSDYMKDMNCPEQSLLQSKDEENDLYLHCQPQPNIAHLAIRQIDQDNYDESATHEDFIIEPLYNFDLQKARLIPLDQSKNKSRLHQIKLTEMRKSKHHSKSPIKDGVSPKKQMFRSLYGQNFAQDFKQEPGQLLSTLGMGNWRGKHRSLNRKEVQTRDKNRRHYEEIVKYESIVKQRLDTKLNSIRIDGIKDKIHDRSQKFGRNRIN